MADSYDIAYKSINELPDLPETVSGSAPVYYNGQYYKRSGVTSSSDVIAVNSPDDLAGDLDSTKLYRLTGIIDMGAQSVTVPEGGLSIGGPNGGRDVSGLVSSENNYDMFISPSGGYSGNVIMDNATFNVTGTNSRVFNLNNSGNFGALDIATVNFGQGSGNCTELGDLSNYRQLFLSGCGFFIDEGFTLNGTWVGGFAILESIVINSTFAGTFLKEGTSLVLGGSSRSDMNFTRVAAGATFFDWDENNVTEDGGIRLKEFRSSATNAVPNLPGTSTKALYRFCEGVVDSYIGGKIVVTTGAATAIATAGTPVKMAGTTTASDLSSFDAGGTNNRLRYISSIERQVKVSAIAEFTGGTNDVMELSLRKYNSSDVLQETVTSQNATLNGGPAGIRAEGVTLAGFTNVTEGDYLELWVANSTDTTDIVTVANTQMIVEER